MSPFIQAIAVMHEKQGIACGMMHQPEATPPGSPQRLLPLSLAEAGEEDAGFDI